MSTINLIHGDCMDSLREAPDNHWDLAICDPPYGIGEGNKSSSSRPHIVTRKNGNRDRVKSNNHKKSIWDNNRPSIEYFNEVKRVSKNQVIWGGNYFSDLLPASSCWIVWNKINGNNDFADCELAWASFKTAVRLYEFMWAGMRQGDTMNGKKHQGNKSLNEKRIHPTQKPVALYKWLLTNYAKEGDTILDTHLGSGSIAIACHDYGFDLTGFEIDKDYFDAATKRLKQHQAQLKFAY